MKKYLVLLIVTFTFMITSYSQLLDNYDGTDDLSVKLLSVSGTGNFEMKSLLGAQTTALNYPEPAKKITDAKAAVETTEDKAKTVTKTVETKKTDAKTTTTKDKEPKKTDSTEKSFFKTTLGIILLILILVGVVVVVTVLIVRKHHLRGLPPGY